MGSVDETSMVSMGVWALELTGVDCVCSVQGIACSLPVYHYIKTVPYVKEDFVRMYICMFVCV